MNKMSIIAEVKVAIEEAIWMKLTGSVQFFKKQNSRNRFKK